MKDLLFDIHKTAMLSGISISIAALTFLNVGGILGAILFNFGLLTVVHYGWKLYTGTCGFVQTLKDHLHLLVILAGNFVGCLLTGFAVRYTQPELIETAIDIINNRVSMDFWGCLLNAIGCGFIMTTAVEFARENKFLPLLFGVPAFILCGFYHSIADAFYFTLGGWNVSYLGTYITIVIGNYIGCNLKRILFL